MAVRLRLQRKGRKKLPFYHIVAADQRAPRDGKVIERIGTYNPMTKPATINLDEEKALEWLNNGAQPSDTVRAMLRYKGVLYRKHLLKGVAKGAMTQEQADQLYADFKGKKEDAVAKRVAQTAEEKLARQKAIAGSKPEIAPPPADEEE